MADRAFQDHQIVLDAPPRPLARRAGAGPLPLESRPSGRAANPSARVGPVRQPVERPDRAVLFPAGLPLLRRTRLQRTRLERLLGGSAIGHALLLAGLALLYARQARLQAPQEPPAVEMVYGQSGLIGQPVSPDQAGGGRPAEQAAPPVPPQEPTVNTDLPPIPPPVPIPDLSPLPTPPPPPPQPKPEQAQRQSQPTRIPLRAAPSRRASNPFAHPMDLSFAEPGPPRARSGHASGSGSSIDLSLGPLVKNGQLNTPFATVGVKGVSDDYGAEIDSWIRRHLYYPPDAAQRGEDGPSHVHVTIDRSGHVKSVRLVDSSGSVALDDSTEGMFRGRTLPPVPPDMVGDHFDIDLTVNYILERR